MNDFEHDSVQLAADETVDMVNSPPHYAASDAIPFQCIEVIRDMSLCAGNAVKYLWRTELKNGREDVDKARWFLEDAVKWGCPTYIGNTPMQWKSRLTTVIRAQTDPRRRDFFTSIKAEELEWALRAVRAMLA